MRQGLWTARASAARPCCPSQGRQRGLVRSRPASAGAWLASTRWCCACCGVSRSRPSPGSSTLAVNEIACLDTACPGVEAVILVMEPGQKTRAYKIAKALDGVTEQDIRDALA